MDLSARAIARSFGRIGAAAQNALEVARFGGLETEHASSPFEVVAVHPVYRLRRYFPTDPVGPPIVLVPPLMLTSEVYDVSGASSAVTQLHDLGCDPWVVDFGAPEREEGGLRRTLTDHVVAVGDAVEQVGTVCDRGVHLAGYSQGGMFCYQAAALRRGAGIDSLITFGSPVDTREMIPGGVPEETVLRLLGFLAEGVLGRYPLPAWASRMGFRLLDPAKSIRQRVDFVRQLHDRDALLPREAQRRFLSEEGWVAFPGPALAELARQFIAQNRLLSGGFVIEGRMSTLADIAAPVLCVVGEVDEIAPPRAVRAVARAAPRAEVFERVLNAGHFGLVVGSRAVSDTWPTVADWVRWRDGNGPRPSEIHPMSGEVTDAELGTLARVGNAVELALDTGMGLGRAGLTSLRRSSRAVQHIVRDAVEQLPRLNRLEGLNPSSKVSMGLLLDEQASRAPERTFFVFEDRGHTFEAAKRRIDNIVRGLIAVGVRQGEHVGVLMDTRPSALAVVAALSRLGAVGVMMRPGVSPQREAELAAVSRIIADPEHGPAAVEAEVAPVLVLGGGGEPRELGFGLTDMERIDPDEVPLPAWYRPNPGRSRDLAYVLFTGEGDSIRMKRITNGRWALSAFGTASAAALGPADTVYGLTPIHHPAGLLTSIGGTIAGGARLALSATTELEPARFWDEVRRYGVTVVSYTWTLTRLLVDAPVQAAEAHHPVRLFMGSGMPPGLWRRTEKRFAPARVLEFYASTEGDAVLVNLTGVKVGSKGRRLPGSAQVRLAAYDIDDERLVVGPDGFVQRCNPGDVGMLLVAAPDRGGLLGNPVRGVFVAGDAWEVTGDLFRRDDDGDHWLVDHVRGLVHGERGPVSSMPIADALGTLEAVDLAIAYGVPARGRDHEVAVAALTLRPGFEPADVDGRLLAGALAELDPTQQPQMIRLVDEIPLTTWHRADLAPVRRQGVPASDVDGRAWCRDGRRRTYRPLTARDRTRLRLG